jgi:hypothetical protein
MMLWSANITVRLGSVMAGLIGLLFAALKIA